MKLVMTILARDEADIVRAQIDFHLNAGVDFVIATDNLSEDGTTELLESYARRGLVHRIAEDGDYRNRGQWRTRMARLAAADFGADWVINADADEFWWGRGATLKDILGEVPRRFSTVRGLMRNFVPRPGDASFEERMTARLVPSELAPESLLAAAPFHPQDKVAHRASPSVTVKRGGHDAWWDGSVDLRHWYPIEILHFPIRSLEHCKRKWRVQRSYAAPGHPGHQALATDRMEDYYEKILVDDAALGQGLREGWLVGDTRVRDAVRLDRDVSWEPTLREDAELAADVAAGADRESTARFELRLLHAEQRLASLERTR